MPSVACLLAWSRAVLLSEVPKYSITVILVLTLAPTACGADGCLRCRERLTTSDASSFWKLSGMACRLASCREGGGEEEEGRGGG